MKNFVQNNNWDLTFNETGEAFICIGNKEIALGEVSVEKLREFAALFQAVADKKEENKYCLAV